MKLKYSILSMFLICLVTFQLHAASLDSLLIKSDSISRLLQKKINTNNTNRNVSSVFGEFCFYSDLKNRIITDLKDSLYLSSCEPLQDELKSFISGQISLLRIIDSDHLKDSLLDIQTAKRIASVTDSAYLTLDKIDGLIKSKTDSIYTNAVLIVNNSKTREIILIDNKLKNTILIIPWIIMIIFLSLSMYLVFRRKFKSYLMYTSIALILIFGFLILKPSVLYPVAGQKTTIPAWEFNTIEGHRLNSTFMKQSKEGKGFDVLKETAVNTFMNYYKSAYTSVNKNHINEMYLNIHFVNSVLYPPACLPDSFMISKQKNNRWNYNPAWFSNYNFSKIKHYNRMQNRGNVHGDAINLKSYNDRLSFLIHSEYKLNDVREDTLKTRTPDSRMKLDLLLKVKAVL